MKYVRLRIRFSEETIHPVHEALSEDDAVERDVLLYGDTGRGPRDTFLFYAEGDADAYRSMLEATPSIDDWELSAIDDGAFYAFITQETPEFDAELLGHFSRTGVLAIPPVEFRPDGTARFTLVGKPGPLQATLDTIPDELDAHIDRIGEYDRRQELFDPGLTDRQFEAVAEAVDIGYYDDSRTATVEAVAERLDLAPATAAEHLRKAERRVMRELVGAADRG